MQKFSPYRPVAYDWSAYTKMNFGRFSHALLHIMESDCVLYCTLMQARDCQDHTPCNADLKEHDLCIHSCSPCNVTEGPTSASACIHPTMPAHTCKQQIISKVLHILEERGLDVNTLFASQVGYIQCMVKCFCVDSDSKGNT